MQILHFNPICLHCKYWNGTFESKTGTCDAINENTHTDSIKIYINNNDEYNSPSASIKTETERFFGCKLWVQKDTIESWKSLEHSLESALSINRFESGYTHQEIELILETVIQQECENYLTDVILNSKKYAMLYDVLCCLAQIDKKPGNLEWRIDFITKCLQHKGIYVRDPAVTLIDQWEESELCEILKNHVEPVDYIKSYVDDILMRYTCPKEYQVK